MKKEELRSTICEFIGFAIAFICVVGLVSALIAYGIELITGTDFVSGRHILGIAFLVSAWELTIPRIVSK